MRVPPYFDMVLAAYRTGQTGRDVHLGYWDEPPAGPGSPAEFAAAQHRMTQRIVGLLPASCGARVLDVACGLGGTLNALNATLRGALLTGVNIDPRQLVVCRSIAPRSGNRIDLILADACALPLPDASQDHVTCVEAMFHFADRARFLAEAARVLRPGGTLVVTDILFGRGSGTPPWQEARIEQVIRRDYGAWPHPWIDGTAITAAASHAGLTLTGTEDWTAATRPSYRIISPHPTPERLTNPDAGAVFRWLHGHGWLSYRMFRWQRTASVEWDVR